MWPSRIARIVASIDRLAETRHLRTAVMGDPRGLRQVRVGAYRVVYEVRDGTLILLVVRVVHFRDSGRRTPA